MSTAVMPTYARTDHAFVKGEGAWLIDADGGRHLDFGAGIAVNCLGHAHPELVAALTAQAGALWHTSNLYRVPNQEALADALCEATFADRVFFTNSGAEAMECAFKTARKYQSVTGAPERTEIVTFAGCFHGRTIATISAAKSPKLVDGFGPMAPDFTQVAYGDVEALRAAVGPHTAAVAVEPVLGEGGIIPAPDGFLKAVREICDETGALMICDEIQSGVGRTGRLFAHEWAGVTPDVMAVAKGIGGGFPLGACLATERAAQGMTAGSHGSTYGGNPLGAAVGLKVLEIVSDPAFLDTVRQRAGFARQRLAALADANPDVIEEVRGEGLMLGLKCKAPNGDVLKAAYDAGLLLVPAADNTLRFLPPLNVTEEEIDEAVARLDAACGAVSAATGAAA